MTRTWSFDDQSVSHSAARVADVPHQQYVEQNGDVVNDFPSITQVVSDSEAEIGEKDSDQAKSACLRCIAGVYIRTGESQSVQVSSLTVGHTG